MAILISFVLWAVLLSAISYFGYRHYTRPARVLEQLGEPAGIAMPDIDRRGDGEHGLVVQVIQQIGEKLPVNPENAGVIRGDLMAAGFRSDEAVAIYLGARAIACVVLAILALALVLGNVIAANPVLRVVIPVGAGFLGFIGPSFYLDHLVTARRQRIRHALPDALDLLVVSVEAGLGLDQAIQYVGLELTDAHPDISEELHMVNLEIRGGTRRMEALRHLADRTGEPEMRKLVAILIQTDRFGTSIADSLRTHSDFMRVRRRQEAEERAGKVGVKLVFPIFFLILPAVMVVAAGPGLLQVFKDLFPMMRNLSIP